jgi:excisionase family DNA binding protein
MASTDSKARGRKVETVTGNANSRPTGELFPPIKPLLVKPAQAAAMISVGRSKIYDLINAGAIPSIRIDDGTLRIPTAALERLVAQAMDTVKSRE